MTGSVIMVAVYVHFNQSERIQTKCKNKKDSACEHVIDTVDVQGVAL